VLVRLDAPVAAFVSPIVWQWLTGDEAGASRLPAQSRAACLAAWRQAGLTDAASGREADSQDGDLADVGGAVSGQLGWPLLAVGVSSGCSFCAQLEADLAANAGFLREAQFGVLLAGGARTRLLGMAARLPASVAEEFVRLTERAAQFATPGGALIEPGRDPVWLSGYDQVTRALGNLSGWDRDLVAEVPTSCSITVLSGGATEAHPVAAGDRVIGLGLRAGAARQLAGYVAGRSARAGYAPPLLVVDRPQNLFLVFRGGEMLARLRTVADVEKLLDTVLAGYAAALSPTTPGACTPLLCGALVGQPSPCDGRAGVVLFPRSWLTELVKQQSRLLRSGWAVCPDPFVPLVDAATEGGVGLWATVHPVSAGSPQEWSATTARVVEILLDPAEPAADRIEPAAQLRAQAVNWLARPATAEQVRALAAGLGAVSVRTCTCPQLVGELSGG
jgi:hypothetical protein